jgi:hypothetical protein
VRSPAQNPAPEQVLQAASKKSAGQGQSQSESDFVLRKMIDAKK